MRLSQLKAGHVDEVQIQRIAGEEFSEALKNGGVEVALSLMQGADSILLRHGENTWLVDGVDGASRRSLKRILGANLPRLSWVQAHLPQQPGRAESLSLSVHGFSFELTGVDLQIGVDEKVVDALSKLRGKKEEAVRWLNDKCILPGEANGAADRVFLSGPRDDDDLEAFVVHGDSIRVFVKKQRHEERQEDIWQVSKISQAGGSGDVAAIAMARGAIGFVDYSQASQVRAQLESQLEDLRRDEKSFVKLWKTYGRLEFEEKLRKARRIGVWEYESWSTTTDGNLQFDLVSDPSPGDLSNIGALEVTKDPPRILEDATVEEVAEELDPTDFPKGDFLGEFDGDQSNLSRCIAVVTPDEEDDPNPPKEGYLFRSFRGDKTNQERRKNAREKIETATSPIPQLSLLLEGGSMPAVRRGDVEVVTAEVQQKVFGGVAPNRSQEKAIWTALNTPDIALIQGPPGTGKTTVIRAIVTRLAEMLDDGTQDTRKVLLSGFQHEAVKNAVEGLDVHGVPAVKFGGPDGKDSYREAMGNLESRRQDIVDRLEGRIPDDSPTKTRRQIDEIRVGYLSTPASPAQTALMLERVLEISGEYLSTALRQRLRQKAGECRRKALPVGDDPKRRRLVSRVRSLRSTPIAFADDGARNAGRLLLEMTKGDDAQRLGVELTGDEASLLERIAYGGDEPEDDDLKALAKLRRRLLYQLVVTDEGRHRRAAVSEEILELLTQVSDELVVQQQRAEGGVDVVAAEFYDVLDRQPFEYRQAIYEMTPAWGATCQQAASHSLARVRKEDLEYDTVIVDEAARANPLDLFIPMTQAKRRIILVGDHRQLPQLVDRKLERRLSEELDSSEDDGTLRKWFREKIKESLFEHLRDVLADREREDGFPYAVSLDTQYRMHPRLGQFISENFYEDSEDGVEIKSPRPAEEFAHQLPGLEHKIAAWIDVPHSSGGEQSRGTSKARRVEAKRLVEHLARLIDCPEAKELSFGVITYYAGQREVLWQEMEKKGLASKTDDGDYEIAEEYRFLDKDGHREERLRVGTVDAFQGREFDVVFLSMVRSNKDGDQSVRDKRRKYGHLMSPNRMNVSMSRQKRLLIVVGDSGMLEADNARAAIEPLVHFYENLCEGPQGEVIDGK